MAHSDYQIFGLRVRSEVPLPELFPARNVGTPDVTIRRGEVQSASGEPGIQPDGEALLLNIPDIARYRIEGGHDIVIDPERTAPDSNVRVFLLGSAFGALLHQRGLLPLHANAVELNGRAFAFMGESGAGKSTLAAWFHDRGHRIIADDVCVVGFDRDGRPYATPGLPRLRLWSEALKLMGREVDGFSRSYVGDEKYDKFDVPIDAANASTSNISLSALYLLERGTEFSIGEMKGVEAADAVFANTYRGGFVSAAGGSESHWRSSIELVRRLPVFKITRKWELGDLDRQCLKIVEHVQAISELPMAEAG